MFEYMSIKDGPVIEGMESEEVIYAACGECVNKYHEMVELLKEERRHDVCKVNPPIETKKNVRL